MLSHFPSSTTDNNDFLYAHATQIVKQVAATPFSSAAAGSSGTSAVGTPLTFLTEDEKLMQETGKKTQQSTSLNAGL